jgi:hypothetical protein
MTHEDVLLIVGAINKLSAGVGTIGTVLILMLVFKNMSGSGANSAISELQSEIKKLRETLVNSDVSRQRR